MQASAPLLYEAVSTTASAEPATQLGLLDRAQPQLEGQEAWQQQALQHTQQLITLIKHRSCLSEGRAMYEAQQRALQRHPLRPLLEPQVPRDRQGLEMLLSSSKKQQIKLLGDTQAVRKAAGDAAQVAAQADSVLLILALSFASAAATAAADAVNANTPRQGGGTPQQPQVLPQLLLLLCQMQQQLPRQPLGLWQQ